MSGYGRFACYYDKLTENVDYGKIAARCHELIKRYSSEHEVVLDLACGTGSLSEALAGLDYDVAGVAVITAIVIFTFLVFKRRKNNKK